MMSYIYYVEGPLKSENPAPERAGLSLQRKEMSRHHYKVWHMARSTHWILALKDKMVHWAETGLKEECGIKDHLSQ
jgi:hypothetical protein